MKRLLTILCLTLCLSGCRSAVVSPVGTGTLFTKVRGPVTATELESKGSKRGESSAFAFLGLVAIGDASIQTAKTQGQIKTVTHVDHESFDVLGLFSSYTLIVYGE